MLCDALGYLWVNTKSSVRKPFTSWWTLIITWKWKHTTWNLQNWKNATAKQTNWFTAFHENMQPPCRHKITTLLAFTISTLPSVLRVEFFGDIYIFICIVKSSFTCFSKVSFQVCWICSFSSSDLISLAENLKSHLLFPTSFPNKILKWCDKTISAFVLM